MQIKRNVFKKLNTFFTLGFAGFVWHLRTTDSRSSSPAQKQDIGPISVNNTFGQS